MNRNQVLSGAAAIVLAVLLVALGIAIGLTLSDGGHPAEDSLARSGHDNEFMFQVDGYELKNRQGQTTNLYFNYRYDDGLADPDIPDYRKLRAEAVGYLDGINPGQNLNLEIPNETMCNKLKADFPIEAISCQMQALPRDNGISTETGL